MLRVTTLLLAIIFISSCSPNREPLTTEELSKEKEAVIDVMKAYNKAFQDKNFAGILPTLSDDVIFFGTDSAEVIKSLSDFKKKITEQFNSVQKMEYGEMTDISVQMDPYGIYSSIIFGVSVDIFQNDKREHMFLRAARNLRKEEGKWVIVSGIIGRAGVATAVVPDTVKP
jgi:ketosteroid isomerase-like protein